MPFAIDLQQQSPLASRGPLLQPAPLVSMAPGFFMASALLGIALFRQRRQAGPQCVDVTVAAVEQGMGLFQTRCQIGNLAPGDLERLVNGRLPLRQNLLSAGQLGLAGLEGRPVGI
ncbi:hypothetical protein LP417_33790 (plasmid) [Polaromonas sp. P1-6]|nr:hypothetical protein LP417_33790 [Polaromonas sp. P1-6]